MYVKYKVTGVVATSEPTHTQYKHTDAPLMVTYQIWLYLFCLSHNTDSDSLSLSLSVSLALTHTHTHTHTRIIQQLHWSGIKLICIALMWLWRDVRFQSDLQVVRPSCTFRQMHQPVFNIWQEASPNVVWTGCWPARLWLCLFAAQQLGFRKFSQLFSENDTVRALRVKNREVASAQINSELKRSVKLQVHQHQKHTQTLHTEMDL